MPFDGATYVRNRDFSRLTTQLEKVKAILLDYEPHRIDEIEQLVGCRSAGVTARVRDLRKEKFGGFRIDSWADPHDPSLWWYWMRKSGDADDLPGIFPMVIRGEEEAK